MSVPKASFVKLTRQTMSLRRHFSYTAHDHPPWVIGASVDCYFKSGVNMMNMLSHGQSYGGKVELEVYARDVYSYDDNKHDEFFRGAYKNGGEDVHKPEVINVSFSISKPEESIDLFNPLCMLKGLRLVLNEQYKVFVAQECGDQLERGTHFDTAPLPWATDVYACVDMLASWMHVVENELPRHEWTSGTAMVMHCVSDKYQQLKSYGDCAPEYVGTEEWGDTCEAIKENIIDAAIGNAQLMGIKELAVFSFHEAYTVVADCYSTPKVYEWGYVEVQALYETITESKEVYELSYNYANDQLPIMDIVYTYNKWMSGLGDPCGSGFVVVGEDGEEEEDDDAQFDAQMVKSIAQSATFFVNDVTYTVYVDDVPTEEDTRVLDELVRLNVCILIKDAEGDFYRSRRYDDMFQGIVKGIGGAKPKVVAKFCFNFKSMADYTAGLVQTEELENVVCLSPIGHHMHSMAYNLFEPIRLYNEYNPFDNGDDEYSEVCKGKHVVLNWASGFGIEAICRIMGYAPKTVHLVDFKHSVGRECATSVMDSLCSTVPSVKELRDGVRCHHLVVSKEYSTLRCIARNGYKSQSKELCALTFTKYADGDLSTNTVKMKKIVEMFQSCVVNRLKKNNTFLHITDGLDDVLPAVLRSVIVSIRKDNMSQEMRDRNMHEKIRAKPDASYTGERGSVGDDIIMPGNRIGTLLRSRQFVFQSKRGRKRATQPRILQPYAGCCVQGTQGPKRDGFAPHYFEVYRTPKSHVNAIKELSIEDTLKCKRLFSTSIGKASGLVDTQHFMLWCTRDLLEIDSTTERPYERLYTLISLLAPHCQRITIALPAQHEYVVAPGEVHYDETKWKRVRDVIMRYQKEEDVALADVKSGRVKSKIVLDSDAEDSDGEEEEDDEEDEEDEEDEDSDFSDEESVKKTKKPRV